MKFETHRLRLFLLVLSVLSVALAAQAADDNANVTALFGSAKTTLASIKKDASDMETFTRGTGLSWRTHGEKLTKMKADVNELSQSVEGMKSQRSTSSEWQQIAIDRISPLMSDLVASMNAAIDHLGKNQIRPTAPPYPAYLKANIRIATDLSSQINDAIDYAEAKETMDRLAEQFGKP